MKLHLSVGTCFTSILIFIFFVFVLHFSHGNSNLSIAELTVHHNIAVKIGYFILVFFPLVFLLLSETWKNTVSIPRKVLLSGLAIFLTSTFYSARYGINSGGLFLACSLFFAISQRRIYKPNKVYYWFWAYLLIHIISLLWTIDIQEGLKEFRVYLLFVTFPLAFCFFQLTREETDRLLLLFFRSATIFVFVSLCCWIYESSRMGIPLIDWFVIHKKMFANLNGYSIVFSWVNYDHPSYISIGCNFAFAVGIYLFDKRNATSKINIFELTAFALFAFVLAIIVQSRIGIINFIVIGVCGIAWLLRKEKKYLYGYICLCLILTTLVLTRFDSILKYSQDDIRFQQYNTAMYYIKSHPWFGTGIGGMAKVMTSQELALKLGYPSASVVNIYPSNQFLGDWMQTGIFGLTILAGMLSSILYYSIKQRNWVLFSLLLIFLLLMLIEMPFFLLKGTTLFVPMTCLLLQMQYRKQIE
jgi:O-antigen ligase